MRLHLLKKRLVKLASPFVDVAAIADELHCFCCAENNYRCAVWIAAHKPKSIVQKMLNKTAKENYQMLMVNTNSAWKPYDPRFCGSTPAVMNQEIRLCVSFVRKAYLSFRTPQSEPQLAFALALLSEALTCQHKCEKSPMPVKA